MDPMRLSPKAAVTPGKECGCTTSRRALRAAFLSSDQK